MTERWKPGSPHTLREGLTVEGLAIRMTEVMKEDIYYPINTEIEAPPANQSNEEKKMSKFRTQISLNKDLFDIFYEYYIDFKNYIIILNLQIIYLRKNLRSYTKQNDGNTINELNDKIQSLTNENNTLKQENKTFLKNNRTNAKRN